MTSADPAPMTYEVRNRAGVTVLHLAGEIDLAAESTMNRAIVSAIAARPTAIVVDLAGVSFLDSTGVRCLITARRDATAAGISLTVREAAGIVEQVLTVTGVLPAFAVPEPALQGAENPANGRADRATGGFFARLGRLTGSSRRNPRS